VGKEELVELAQQAQQRGTQQAQQQVQQPNSSSNSGSSSGSNSGSCGQAAADPAAEAMAAAAVELRRNYLASCPEPHSARWLRRADDLARAVGAVLAEMLVAEVQGNPFEEGVHITTLMVSASCMSVTPQLIALSCLVLVCQSARKLADQHPHPA